MKASLIQKAVGFAIRPHERLVASTSGGISTITQVRRSIRAGRFGISCVAAVGNCATPTPIFRTAWYCENCHGFDADQSNAVVHDILKGSAQPAAPLI